MYVLPFPSSPRREITSIEMLWSLVYGMVTFPEVATQTLHEKIAGADFMLSTLPSVGSRDSA